MMKKNKNASSMTDARTKVGTLIGKGAVIEGNITAPETVRLDGTLNGNCDCKENLIIGVDGQVNGDITAQNVLISGNVEGDIFADGKIELLATGKILGNITAKSLVIDENACFDGRCSMTTAPVMAANSVNGKADKGSQKETSSESEEYKSGKK